MFEQLFFATEKRIVDPFVYPFFLQQNKIGYKILIIVHLPQLPVAPAQVGPAAVVLSDSARRPAPAFGCSTHASSR